MPASAADVVVADVPAGTERATAIAWAVANRLLPHTPGGAFRPTEPALRRVTVKLLWRAAGTAGAWERTFAGAALLSTADGWWDTAAWDGTGDQLPDLSGGGHPLFLAPGDVGPPLPLGFDPDERPYIYHPGWDDMILDTPDSPSFPTGDFEFRIDADLTLELATNGSPDNFVFHQGGTGDDASLAVSFLRTTGAPALWYSVDGTSWRTLRGDAPAIGDGRGRRGVRFVANDGAGGHRVEFYEQAAVSPPGNLELPFEDPAWHLFDSVTSEGVVVLHDSARAIAMSSGHDQIPAGNLAAGWGQIHRMTLQTPTSTVFDLDAASIALPLTWTRSGPIPGAQPCWCMPDDDAGPAKDGSFIDDAGANWTIHNWQTGSTPIAVVDRPSVILGNNARLMTAPTDAFAPGPEGLSVVLGFRWTRSGISGSFLYSHRLGSINQDNAGWGSLSTGFLCCGPAFGVSNGSTNSAFARSPIEVDGVATSTVGVFDSDAGQVMAYTGGNPGQAEPAASDAGRVPSAQPFAIGGDPDTTAHSYGGFEFFGAAIFRRPLGLDEVVAIDEYLADPDRQPDVAIPAPLRFA